MIPDPKPSSFWTVEAKTPTQMLLAHKNGCKLAIELQKNILAVAAIDAPRVKMSASIFRASVVELWPDYTWGKLPRHSKNGLRAMAKIAEPEPAT